MTLDLPSSYEQPDGKPIIDSSWAKIFSILDDRPLGERVKEQKKERKKNGEDSGGSELDASEDSDSFGKVWKNQTSGTKQERREEKKQKQKQKGNRDRKKKRKSSMKNGTDSEETLREVKKDKWKSNEDEDIAHAENKYNLKKKERNGKETEELSKNIKKEKWKISNEDEETTTYSNTNKNLSIELKKEKKTKQEGDDNEHANYFRTEKRSREEMEEELEGYEWEPKQEQPDEKNKYAYQKEERDTWYQPIKKFKIMSTPDDRINPPYEVINVYEEKQRMKKEIAKKYESVEFEEEVKRKISTESSDQIDEDSIAFGTFDFSTGRPLPVYLTRLKHQIIPLTQKIKMAKKREKALAAEGKAGENLREFHHWKKVMDKENGLKTIETAASLKKIQKRAQKDKQKHREEWAKREKESKEAQEAHQKKRDRNIKKKKDANLERKINRRWGLKNKTKQRRPGFEGRKKHFINK